MRIQVQATKQETSFTLTRAETLVLLDFLSRFDKGGQPDIRDQAEQLLFWHLLSALKRALPELPASDYLDKIVEAREAVKHSA